MDCCIQNFPVLHHISEFTQTCVNWVNDAILWHLLPLLTCPQSFPELVFYPVSLFFTSGGQSIGTSTSASVLSMNIQGSFTLGLTGLISVLSNKLSRVFSSTIVWKHWFFCSQSPLRSQLSHPYMTIGKTIALTRWTCVGKVMVLVFNTLGSSQLFLQGSSVF